MQDQSVEWDDRKATLNPLKHKGITFGQAREVFLDTDAEEVIDETTNYFDVDGNFEERINITGLDAAGNVLVVSYTWRGLRRRIITARLATPQERSEHIENRPAFADRKTPR